MLRFARNDAKQSALAAQVASELCSPPTKRKKAKKQKEGRRSAERRIVRQLPLARQRDLLVRRARLPALRHGTRHRLSPRWLSPRPGFPQRRGGTVFCPHAAKLSCVKHAPCRPVLLPADRCPRAARERFARPRAGIRTRSAVKIASGMRPSVSEIRKCLYPIL